MEHSVLLRNELLGHGSHERNLSSYYQEMHIANERFHCKVTEFHEKLCYDFERQNFRDAKVFGGIQGMGRDER